MRNKMRVSLKKAFTILDGRLSTKMDDVYEMLNFIFSENLYTHQIPVTPHVGVWIETSKVNTPLFERASHLM